jgi:chromosome partitioning protein
MLSRIVQKLTKQGIALIVIDTPPHNSTAAASAAKIADYVLVPVRPASFDLAAVTETADLIQHSGVRGGAVLNAIPPSTSVADMAEQVLVDYKLPVIARVGQRMAFQHAATIGQGVCETEPRSVANNELTQLWNAIQEASA